MNKETKIKTKCHKKTKHPHEMGYAEKIASICDCSPAYVRIVWGKHPDDIRTRKAQQIVEASNRIADGESKLVQAVKDAIAV